MRVVVDPGSHAVLNLGDVAMLQVAVGRLRAEWPDVRVDVLTTDPAALARHCPDASPLAAAGRYGFVEGRGEEDGDVRAYLEALRAADLFLVCGRGGLADAFPEEARALLAELELAHELHVPTALTGQGIGPLDDHFVRAKGATVLPGALLVAVREGTLAPRLLDRLGVAPARVVVTGDDAVEPAFQARRAAPARERIGLSLRAAPYAGAADDASEGVGRAVRAAARRHATTVAPVPISLYPHEDDAGLAARVGGAEGSPVETAADAIAAAGGCRVVVTGTYHAGVFAAAQGVPVVGLVGSPYYAAKLEGLRDAFRAGVSLVRLDAPELEERLGAAIDFAWDTPPRERALMLAAAERQAAASRAAYSRLAAEVATVSPMPAGGTAA